MVVVERDPYADEPGDGEGSGGCLIANAAHGTELAPQVQALREYRDGTLLATGAGSASTSSFSAAYYAFSPYVADLERGHPAARQAAAALIAPLLYALRVAAWADPYSESSVLAHGIAATLLPAGLYIGAPAAAAVHRLPTICTERAWRQTCRSWNWDWRGWMLPAAGTASTRRSRGRWRTVAARGGAPRALIADLVSGPRRPAAPAGRASSPPTTLNWGAARLPP